MGSGIRAQISRLLVFAGACIMAHANNTLIAQGVQLVNAFPHVAFTQPLFVTHSRDGTNRIFVVQQNGIIRVFPNDPTTASTTTFLNIANKLSSSNGEEGLLGLAFHPKFATNGYFYVDYTAPNPLHTVIARFSVSRGNPDKADSLSEYKLLEIYQPYPNHNGGMLMFADDGYLYIGMGDGGNAGDPQNRAQNLDSLLGKILRINVDTVTATTRYGIPPDNPLVGSGHRAEIFAWGLRNPWRFSQDPVTGRIWLGDVGQNLWEEVDLLAKGMNYGWRIMEGFHCYNPASGCNTAGLVLPLKEYSHAPGDCSVTGGYVYRGSQRPDLVGAYVYGDYCTGKIWILRFENGMITADSLLLNGGFPLSSFGVDQNNELYICNYSGSILRFAGGVSTAVEDPGGGIPVQTVLEQNFPNPFNPSTHIRYSIPNAGRVRLSVFNVLGQEVAVIVEEMQRAGMHDVEFRNPGLSSGVYFYRLQAPGVVTTRELVLSK